MQVVQDWTIFRWSRITLVSDPAGKLIRMTVHVFSDSALCVGVSNPDPSSNWETQLEDVCYEHRFVEKLNLVARELQFIWHVLQGASTLHIKTHIQRCVNGQTPESFDEGIIFMSMFNDKERQYRNLFAQCQGSGSICDQVQARTLVLPGARVRKHVVERKFQRTSRKMRWCRMANGSHFQVSHFSPDISSDRATATWTVEGRTKGNYHFQCTFDNKKILIRSMFKTMEIRQFCISKPFWLKAQA